MSRNTTPQPKDIGMYKMQKRLVNVICCIIVVVLSSGLIVLYQSEQNSYREHLQSANDNTVYQIGVTYEMAIANVRNIINATTLYNTETLTMSKDGRETREGKTEILNLLSVLSVMNEFIHSAYLYFPEEEMVFSSYGAPSTIVPMEQFWDTQALQDINIHSAYTLDPRFLPIQSLSLQEDNLPLVVSVVVGVPLSGHYKSSYLVMNINAQSLYSTISQRMQMDSDINYQILSQDDHVIFHRDRRSLFMPAQRGLEQSRRNVTSTYYSPQLGWTFELKNTTTGLRPGQLRLLVVLIAALLLTLGGAFLLTKRYSAMHSHILQTNRASRWKEYLRAEPPDSTEIYKELVGAGGLSECTRYAVITISHGGDSSFSWLGRCFESVRELLDRGMFVYHLAEVMPGMASIILGYRRATDTAECMKAARTLAGDLLDYLDAPTDARLSCYISEIKESPYEIREAYRETLELMEHNYVLHFPVVCHGDMRIKKAPLEYPTDLECQLINYLTIGNTHACHQMLSEIFSCFHTAPYTLTNREILQHVYVLQNNILRHMLTLPVPIRISTGVDYSDSTTLVEIEQKLHGFLDSILDKLQEQQGKDYLMHQSVLEYIDANCTRNDFCLDVVSEELSMNRKYISRILKEATGRSFTEHFTYLRIEKSKELLRNASLTVDDISKRVGYNYSYYFIRKFKQLEGITPGQYAENLSTVPIPGKPL